MRENTELEKFMRTIDKRKQLNDYLNSHYRGLFPEDKVYTELENFCDLNNIKWSIEWNPVVFGYEKVKCTFEHISTKQRFSLVVDEDFIQKEPVMFERNIIRLTKEFNLKEKENNFMPTKTNYSSLYVNGNLFGSNRPGIKDVIFHDPATIVYWADGTKTVVKCQEGDIFDKEKGLAMAICKKMLGTNESKANFNDIFKKWIPEEKPVDVMSSNVAYYTVKELSEEFNVSTSTIIKDIKKGVYLGAKKENGKWLIPIQF